jgi:hypothetical protein
VQPFRIICETCHARLKVSSASAIGEIHACPKCGSMVEVRPPTDGASPPPSTIGGASIEIGTSVMPRFDDFAMVTPEVADPPAIVVSEIPAATQGNGLSKSWWWAIGGGLMLVTGGIAAVILLRPHDSSAPAATPVHQAPPDRTATIEPVIVAPDPSLPADSKAKPPEAPVTLPNRRRPNRWLPPRQTLRSLNCRQRRLLRLRKHSRPPKR